SGLTLDFCPSSLPIRVVGSGDFSEGLQYVYDYLLPAVGTIRTHSYLRDGPLVLDLNKEVKFEGGFNCDFSDNTSSPSTIESLTIDGGSGPVTIDNIEIR
ncbi:MAG: hypothetical protein KKG35_15385, partial [Proteobacteria bacterium]|nr:hypothetical protein [Pseudomonadota bacterium]